MSSPRARRLPRWRSVLAAVPGVVVAAVALVGGTLAMADTASALASPAPTVSAQPAAGLMDGQVVVVSGTGFPPATQVAVGECEAGATKATECSIAGATVVSSAADGSFTTNFTVSRVITVGSSTIDCSSVGACVIGAAALPALSTYATTPIAFAAVAPPAPPPPASPATRYDLALGDSLAVGFGAPTGEGYVDLLATAYGAAVPGLQLENLGCSGETTTTFRDGGTCPYTAGSQLAAAEAFLTAHAGQVAVVTIDVGGDDISKCASTTPPFSISESCVTEAVATVSANLDAIGAGLRAAAGPSVPIVGMTYFDPFVVEWLSGPDGQAAAQASVAALGQLNAALIDAYGSFGARVADVEGAFSTTDVTPVLSPFGTIPKNVAVACTWLLAVCSATGPIIVGVHPNAAGYAAIAAAFEAVLPPSALASPVAPAPPSPPSPLPPAPTVPTLAFSGFAAAELGGIGVVALGLGGALVGIGRRRRSRASAAARDPRRPARPR